jgi:tocopherol O-methyltransferase
VIIPKQPQSTAAVAAHYDELDRFYREIWGDHVHHGYWDSGRETAPQAAEALVDQLARRLELSAGQAVCDIGCGYGATAQILAERFDVHVTGLTVSGVQAARGQARRPVLGALSILEQDWLANQFPDAAFDRAYSVESSEHMPDKPRFFSEAWRVLKPGGRLVVFAWLACPDPKPWEVQYLLEPICREGRLPGMGSEADYRALGREAGFDVVSVEDISPRVRRTWAICLGRVLARLLRDREYRRFLLDHAQRNRVFLLTVIRIMIAYRTRSMRYAMFVFDKG